MRMEGRRGGACIQMFPKQTKSTETGLGDAVSAIVEASAVVEASPAVMVACEVLLWCSVEEDC